MPHTHGNAADFDDLIKKIIAWSTDSSIHGDQAWELMQTAPWPKGTILKGHGFNPGEHFYAGLMPLKIKGGETYRDWFMQKDILAKHFVWSSRGLNQPDKNFDFDGRTIRMHSDPNVPSSRIIEYAFIDTPEIFTASSQALFLGTFKQYSAGLDWHEQPGGMNFPHFAPRTIFFSAAMSGHSGTASWLQYSPPLMPGVGYPAIGMEYDGPYDNCLEYWLTKDAHRMIIVTKNSEYWDAAYVGLLEPYHDQQYSFPAVAIGGTSGAVTTGRDVWLPHSESPMALTGIQFDYRPVNWSFNHGIPTFAGAAIDKMNTISSVMLMLPDGQWQAFANWMQGLDIKTETFEGKVTRHLFGRAFPQRASEIRHFIRPTETSTAGLTHIYNPGSNSIMYQTEPLELVEGNGQRLTNMFGHIWRMYYPSSKVMQYGEVKINGKLYLMLPNAWENRRFHLYSSLDGVFDPDDLFKREQSLEKMSRPMNCLIRLED